MPVNHRIVRLVVAVVVGLVVAITSYQWITDTERSTRRADEEAVVFASRDILRAYVAEDNLEISDPLDRVRDAGKVYLFPTSEGWELSGHYRRPGEKEWHAFLMAVGPDTMLIRLTVQDADDQVAEKAAVDAKFSASE
jgi:hypothetical protein